MFLKFSKVALFGTVAIGTGSLIFPQQFTPVKKVLNVAVAGGKIYWVYKYTQSNTIQQKNRIAAGYLHQALSKNGGLYLKLGQLIATLDVIVPDEYREVLGTLTRNCPVSSFEKIQALIDKQTGFTIDQLFSQFSQQPISSASIGQVHKARLKTGQEVAVKVQHPDLRQSVEYDLKLMKFFVSLANKAFSDFKYNWLIEEFDKNIRVQLDFLQQANNIQRLGEFIKEQKLGPKLAVPKVYFPLTKRLLIMQFIHGNHIDQVKEMASKGIQLRQIGQLFSNLITKMIHKKGFVHADPHGGNLKIRVDSKGQAQLVILDHGLYQELSSQMKQFYNNFWLGLVLNDQSIYDPAARALGAESPKMLVSMLTSKTQDQLNDPTRKRFDLNPSGNRDAIMQHAAKHHQKIVETLNQLKREILLLLKVNQFARSIENSLGGRPLGVYEDIAKECVQNLGLGWWRRFLYYWRMYWLR